ncbi:Uncharacterised protein [Mycobacteroides abscessus subsp. abscessus]|nr:Uncharacterised protein [Mycobacteroides abscessus subsp. abscessus]
MFDVGARIGIGTASVIHCGSTLFDRRPQRLGALCVGDGHDLDEVRAPGVEAPAVEHRSHGDRRRFGILDDAGVAAAVGALPPAAGGHPVDHMHREQFDAVIGQRVLEFVAHVAVHVRAHRAVDAVFVDDHRDGRIRVRGGGHVREMSEGVGQGLEESLRQVDAQDRTHLAADDRDEYQ